MKNLVKLMMVSALLAIISISCDRDAVSPKEGETPTDLSSQKKENANGRQALLACCSSSVTSFSGSTVAAADVGDYCDYAPINFSFCNDSEINIQWEGQFNSFVRGKNGWNVSYVPDTFTSNDWCNLIEEIDGAGSGGHEHEAPGTQPTCNGGFCNVTGINDPTNVFGGAAYGVGYYTYIVSGSNRTIDPFRDLIIWKNDNLSGTWNPCTAYDICTATRAYRLKINSITPVAIGAPPTSFRGSLNFTWTCLTVEECEDC